jgi:hypothetical protein
MCGCRRVEQGRQILAKANELFEGFLGEELVFHHFGLKRSFHSLDVPERIVELHLEVLREVAEVWVDKCEASPKIVDTTLLLFQGDLASTLPAELSSVGSFPLGFDRL